MNFIAKMFHYINGELKVIIKEFDKLEDAVVHGLESVCHSFKVYNKHGELCHEHKHHHHDTYA